MDELYIRKFQTLFNQQGLTPEVISLFRKYIWQYYREHGRTFSWRETHDSYHILVSEVMLQQTQTSRVVIKYNEFISAFPDFFELARAPLREVLRVWQGLGYNRRALALQQIAREVVAEYNGILPSDPEVLLRFPGIGPYTAAAVAAFAFNKPAVLLETNIRTTFIYFFFSKRDRISNGDIRPMIEATLDKQNPREWYYALFDFGALLKQQQKGVIRREKRGQSHFKGSDREIRGNIIRLLVIQESIAEQGLIELLQGDREHIKQIISKLYNDGLIDICDSRILIRQ